MSDSNNNNIDPNYDAVASAYSKRSIFTFLATFVGCLIFFNNTTDYISGAIFVVVGMFSISILVSFPVFILRNKHAEIGSLIDLLGDALAIALTAICFAFFFTDLL